MKYMTMWFLIMLLFSTMSYSDQFNKEKICGSSVKVNKTSSNPDSWQSSSEYPDIYGISVNFEKDKEYSWSIYLAIAEHIREEPLETEFRNKILHSIKKLSGIDDSKELDREIWVAKGSIDGELLANAVIEEIKIMCPSILDALIR